MPILADYFIVVSVPTERKNIEVDGVEPTILYRYPEQDHKKHRFPENAPFFCFPEGTKIEYKSKEQRKPFFFTFCFTVEDGSRSYGTTLFYYEPLKIDGEKVMNNQGKPLYVPKALCLLSHQPMFSAFAIFLRELYRNAICAPEDSVGEDAIEHVRKSSFNSKLRKGSTCNVIDDSLVVDCPVERQIRFFIDFCPSLDPSLQLNLIAFQKLIEITMPPAHALPFTDRLCYESLLNSLSAKNIIKVVAMLLQEQRILLVSTQMDTLTLCAESFISLLYPFKWMHPFVPLLPTQLIEYLEAPTPYLMGVQTHVYDTDECQQALDGVIVVQLDYDKIIVPKGTKVESFPKPFIKKMEKFVSAQIPPPSTRILYCTSSNPIKSDYLVFEVMFGPGRMGIKMKGRKQCLAEGEEAIDVVYLENVPDEDITIVGPGKRVPLLRREPVILAINGSSVIGKSLKQVVQILSDAPRPLTLRLQVGCTPAQSLENSLRSSLTPVSESPYTEEVSSPEASPMEPIPSTPTLSSSLSSSAPGELSLDCLDSIPFSPTEKQALSPRLLSPMEEDGVVHRYYRGRSRRSLLSEESEEKQDEEETKEEDEETKHRTFYENLRIQFLLEMCELLEGYSKYIREEADVDPENVFNTKSFLKKVDEEKKPLLKAMCKTQLFSHFIHDAYEYDDNFEVQVFNDVMKLHEELEEYTEDYVIDRLIPTKWHKQVVDVPPCDLRGLPDGWEGRVFQRDPEIFPALDPELFGESVKRMKVPKEEVDTDPFVPEDLKALKKSLKAKAKAKKSEK